MTKPATTQKARGALRMARLRIAAKYPFHGVLISDWRMISDRSQRTMAITVDDLRICLLYNPAFVDHCTLDEILGTLHHEVNHVVLRHLTSDLSDMPDDQARIIAEELSANEYVREPLPGQPITLADYPDFPAGESTRRRYERLLTQKDSPRNGQSTGGSVPNLDQHVPKKTLDVPNHAPAAQENARPEPLDDHSLWAKAQETPVETNATIRAAVRIAWDSLDAGAKRALEPELRRRVASLCHGDAPSSGVEAVDLNSAGEPLDWRRLLRQFVSLPDTPQESFAWPSRRLPDILGIVPGRRRHRGRVRVMATLDTSGSISSELLAKIAEELIALHCHHEIIVVECDATVQAVYPFSGKLTMVRGRGGTDLRPPLRPRCWRPLRPDVIVYFTDGFGPAPSYPPGRPLLWCLTPEGEVPAPYGRVAWMRPDLRS